MYVKAIHHATPRTSTAAQTRALARREPTVVPSERSPEHSYLPPLPSHLSPLPQSASFSPHPAFPTPPPRTAYRLPRCPIRSPFLSTQTSNYPFWGWSYTPSASPSGSSSSRASETTPDG